VLVVNGVLVRRSGVAVLKCRWGGLAPETQYSENGEPNPVWAFAHLCRLGLCLMTISVENPA
jgi:hypothetical protein